ncbi:MAG: NYN domain-containing protein [Acidobacteria bacterium]|nr:NYN domain-containing protein [Acidobacteriota bacterium]
MIAWLIDMGYITKASKGRFKLDYIGAKQLIEQKLQDRCQASIFNSVDKHYGVDKGLAQFYHTMRQAGFTVHLYPMEGAAQRQVDVAIASHAVWRATQGDTIILSSGDIDFLPAVKLIVENAQQKIVLFTYDFGVHDELIGAASEHWIFEDYPQLERGG